MAFLDARRESLHTPRLPQLRSDDGSARWQPEVAKLLSDSACDNDSHDKRCICHRYGGFAETMRGIGMNGGKLDAQSCCTLSCCALGSSANATKSIGNGIQRAYRATILNTGDVNFCSLWTKQYGPLYRALRQPSALH